MLIVEIEGERQEIPVTPKLDLEVRATGDAGFVRPGQLLRAQGTLSNDRLFLQSVSVRPVRRGQKLPPGRIEKAPAEPGQSTMSYIVTGPIVALRPNKDYPDHMDLLLKIAGPVPPIMLEPGFTVTVNSNDPDLIPANSPAEIKVVPLRGGRFNFVAVSVELSEPLSAAEYFGDEPKPDADEAGSGTDQESAAPQKENATGQSPEE